LSPASVFASAEEFADLLNSANDSGVSRKQSAWEKRSSVEDARDQPKGRPRKGAGGAGKSVGYKPAPAPGRAGAKGAPKKSGAPSEKPSFKQMKRKQMDSKGSSSKKKGGGGKHKGKKQKH
jgi:hypothetical protein